MKNIDFKEILTKIAQKHGIINGLTIQSNPSLIKKVLKIIPRKFGIMPFN